jgi:hypothetical protein
LFIDTFPKCGTTWLSQILHQLRQGGDEDITYDHMETVHWLKPGQVGF